MVADAAEGVTRLGPLITFGAVVFVVLAILAVLVDGSNSNLIRRTRQQQKSADATDRVDQATPPDET